MDFLYVTKASSGRAKLEFLFTKIGLGWELIWPRDIVEISKERVLHPPLPPLPPEKIDSINNDPPRIGLKLIERELIWDILGVVLGCHEGTIGCGRLFLKDFFVGCKHFSWNRNPNETFSQAFGTLARHSFTALSWYTPWWHSCKTFWYYFLYGTIKLRHAWPVLATPDACSHTFTKHFFKVSNIS